jgi:DNA-binding response OmpR family regulator
LVVDPCPLCGGELPADGRVMVNLDSNTLRVGEQMILLTAREAEVMTVLIDVMPGVASRQQLMDAVYGRLRSAGDWNVIRVMIMRIRKKIKSLPLRIETVNRRGYRLVVGREGQDHERL